MLQGRGAPIWTARGLLAAGASWLSCVLPASACPNRSTGSWAVSPCALCPGVCAAGITLLGLHSPVHTEPLPELLSGPYSPLLGELPLSCSGGPPGHGLQPFTALFRAQPLSVWCTLSWGAVHLLMTPEPGCSTALPGILPKVHVSTFLSGKIGKFLLLQD